MHSVHVSHPFLAPHSHATIFPLSIGQMISTSCEAVLCATIFLYPSHATIFLISTSSVPLPLPVTVALMATSTAQRLVLVPLPRGLDQPSPRSSSPIRGATPHRTLPQHMALLGWGRIKILCRKRHNMDQAVVEGSLLPSDTPLH
jgi:hypothetical protein